MNVFAERLTKGGIRLVAPGFVVREMNKAMFNSLIPLEFEQAVETVFMEAEVFEFEQAVETVFMEAEVPRFRIKPLLVTVPFTLDHGSRI
jgi:hypothetical protein